MAQVKISPNRITSLHVPEKNIYLYGHENKRQRAFGTRTFQPLPGLKEHGIQGATQCYIHTMEFCSNKKMRVSALFKHVCPIHLQFRVIWNVKTSDRKVAYFWMENKWF